MNKLDEMKNYVILHAKTLGIHRKVSNLLLSIDSLSDDSSSGWGNIFWKEARHLERNNNHKEALGLYNIARFPYPATTIQHRSYDDYISLFKKMYIATHKLEEKITSDERQRFYIKHGKTKDIVIICGGIISLKEQWISALDIFHSLGFTVILTEMPCVGENEINFNIESFNMFSDILNVIDFSHENRCHLLAMSFSGYIALKNSCIDDRINAITMVGTPIYDLYHNVKAFKNLPKITKDVLINNINKNNQEKIYTDDELFNLLHSKFSPIEKANKDLKVFYLQSKYDEIISLTETSHLENKCSFFNKLCLPDVHGSPNYHKTVVFYIIWSVLKSMNNKAYARTLLIAMIFTSRIIYRFKTILNND
ncbi:alpha/beta hydrolase [Photorhabdus laumondii]|uniref:alpha/beta hydrolase n=1 Tax=Photorhabdus laumondii TaxID=2218628 RepID=UPI0033152AC9